MAREIETVHQFEHSQKFGLSKEKTVIRCDDGAIYEFEKAADQLHHRLVRGFQPDGTMTHIGTSSRLPEAVSETVAMMFAGWSK